MPLAGIGEVCAARVHPHDTPARAGAKAPVRGPGPRLADARSPGRRQYPAGAAAARHRIAARDGAGTARRGEGDVDGEAAAGEGARPDDGAVRGGDRADDGQAEAVTVTA